MSRSKLYLAATLAALFLTAGCGETVDNPSLVDGSTDMGNTDTGVATSTLTVKMGDIGDETADVSIIEDGKADASPIWTGRLARFETARVEVLPATYAITVMVDGYLPWDISVPVGNDGAEVPVPEEELEPEEPLVDYSWLERTWTCLNVADPTGSPFDIDCEVDHNSLLQCDDSFVDTELSDPGLTLLPEIPGFDYTFLVSYFECR